VPNVKGHWFFSAGCVLVVSLLSCSNGSPSPTPDAGSKSEGTAARLFTRESILEACVRIHSCGVEKLARVPDCILRYEGVHQMTGQAALYETLYTCVNTSGGDCEKVLACFGVSSSDKGCDKAFKEQCEGTARRYCELGAKKIHRVDCAAGGLTCLLDSNGMTFCGARPCSAPGEVICDGRRKLTCQGAGYQVYECEVYGLDCGLNKDGVMDCVGTGPECDG
jgi:hypothetical protein